MSTKFCKDCKWHYKPGWWRIDDRAKCLRKESVEWPHDHIVSGAAPKREDCIDMRRGGACGMNGTLWELK